MNLGGLSADQAPPVDAPLVLFHQMPIFLALSGLLLIWQGDQVLLSRWTPAALATTHLLVLGSLAPVMCGALLQISPVLIGTPYPYPLLVARLTASGLAVGCLLLCSGFLTMNPSILISGGVTTAAGFAIFLVATAFALAAHSIRRETLWSLRMAATALAVTVTLGLLLVLVRADWVVLPHHTFWVNAHASWGLAGWLGLLLAGVGMELIPMFYISPTFPNWLKSGFPPTLFLTLLLITLLGLMMPKLVTVPFLALFLAYLMHTAYALYTEQQRQRPRRDASLWLWQTSHLTFFLAFFAWLLGASMNLIGGMVLASALAFTVGSLIKILPFLVWLDLRQNSIVGSSAQSKLPRMAELLPRWLANAIASTMILALSALAGSAIHAPLIHLVGVLLLLCSAFLLLTLAIIAAKRRHAERL
jgi:hypothetical protein